MAAVAVEICKIPCSCVALRCRVQSLGIGNAILVLPQASRAGTLVLQACACNRLTVIDVKPEQLAPPRCVFPRVSMKCRQHRTAKARCAAGGAYQLYPMITMQATCEVAKLASLMASRAQWVLLG